MARPAPRILGRRYVLQCRACGRWFHYRTRLQAELAYAVHIDGILTDLIKPCPHREHGQALAPEAVSVATGGKTPV